MYATRVTFLDTTIGITQLNDGDSVAIHNMMIQNTTGSAVDITFTQGSAKGDITVTTIGVTVGAGSMIEWNPCAILDRGFRIPALASGVTVTISWRPGI